MHPAPATDPDQPSTLGTPASAPTRGLAVASISLGFMACVVFFWHPFSTLLSSVGLILALVAVARGVRGGLHGERLSLAGLGLCTFALSVVLILNQGLRYVQWDH